MSQLKIQMQEYLIPFQVEMLLLGLMAVAVLLYEKWT